MWKCPECKKEIETLNYQVNTNSYEYGSAYLKENPKKEEIEERSRHEIITDYDCNDTGGTEWVDIPTYDCPECMSELNISNLIWENNIKKPEKKPEEEFEELNHNIITTTEIKTSNIDKYIQNSFLICKHCFYTFATPYQENYINDEEEACPKCNKSTNQKEFNKLLEQGFFNPLI